MKAFIFLITIILLLKKVKNQSGYVARKPNTIIAGAKIISDTLLIAAGEVNKVEIMEIDPKDHSLKPKELIIFSQNDENYKQNYYLTESNEYSGRLTCDDNFNVLFANKRLRLLKVNKDGPSTYKDSYKVPFDVTHDAVDHISEKNYFISAETSTHRNRLKQKAFRLSSTDVKDINEFELDYVAGGVCSKSKSTYIMVTPTSRTPRKIFDHTTPGKPVKLHQMNTGFQREMTCLMIDEEDLYFVTFLNQVVGQKFSDESIIFQKNLGNGEIIATKRIPFTDLIVASRINSLVLTIFDLRDEGKTDENFQFGGNHGQVNQIDFFKELRVLMLISGLHDDKIYLMKMPQYPCYGICNGCDEIIKKNCINCGPNSKKVEGVCKCNEGFWENGVKEECSSCSKPCVTCSKADFCLTCAKNYELFGSGKCRCIPGYWEDEVKKECSSCSKPCVTCSKADFCLTCAKNYELFGSGKCRCILGYWEDIDIRECKKCHESCEDCKEADSCLKCSKEKDYKMFDILGKNKCYERCEIGEFVDDKGSCQPCKENCDICLDITGECSKCSFTYILEEDKTCKKEEVKHELLLTSKIFLKKENELHFSFTEEISPTLNIPEVLSLKLYSKDSTKIKFDLNSLKTSEKEGNIIIAQFKIKTSVDNGKFILSNTTALESNRPLKDGRKMRFKYQEITVENINYFFSESTETIKKTVKPSQNTIKTTSAVTTWFSSTLGVIQLNLIQFLNILRLIDIELPVNFIAFLDIFSENFFDFLKNFLETKEVKTVKSELNKQGRVEGVNFCVDPHPKIEENELKCYFLNNQGSLVTEVLGLFLIFSLSAFCLCCQKEKKEKSYFYKFLSWIKKLLGFSFWFKFFCATQLEFLSAAFVNMRNFYFYPFFSFLNSTLSVITIGIYLKIIYHSFKMSKTIKKFKLSEKNKSKKKRKKDLDYEEEEFQKNIKKWSFLTSNLEMTKKSLAKPSYFYKDFILIRNTVTPFSILIFLNYPLIQILLPLISHIFCFYVLLTKIPYKSKRVSFITIVNDFANISILTIFFLIYCLNGNMSSETGYKIFGFLLIILTSLCVGMNIFIGFVESYFEIVEFCEKLKEKKKTKENAILAKNEGLPQRPNNPVIIFELYCTMGEIL